jgi:hypothetical protein
VGKLTNVQLKLIVQSLVSDMDSVQSGQSDSRKASIRLVMLLGSEPLCYLLVRKKASFIKTMIRNR